MRVLPINPTRFTKVLVLDEPGQGNACHEYSIGGAAAQSLAIADEFGHIKFQNGPVKEFGVNGCHQEDLLAIVIDRLRSFQSGEFACRENAIALTKLEEAVHWLNHRTSDREQRGVEGTNTK
jgi:hypothetical protein